MVSKVDLSEHKVEGEEGGESSRERLTMAVREFPCYLRVATRFIAPVHLRANYDLSLHIYSILCFSIGSS